MGKRIGIMLARPYEKRLLDRMQDRVIVQPKIDGDRMRAVPTKEGYVLYSSQGNVIKFLQHINKDLDDAFSEVPLCDRATFDGEAYLHGWSHQDIRSVVSRTKNESDYSWAIEYHIFDIISGGDQFSRMLELKNYNDTLLEFKSLKMVRTVSVVKGCIQQELEHFMSLGYEGIIVRDPRGLYELGKRPQILKVKPSKIDKYLIMGTFEAIDKKGVPKGILGGFVLGDRDGHTFSCGGGILTHGERRDYWERREELKGKVAVIKYLALTNIGIPREPILMEVRDEAWEEY